MKNSEFRAGQRWAYRTAQRLATVATEVELLAWAARKPPQVKVRHVAGELADLEEWVRPAHLLVPWREWPRRLRHEQREAALAAATPTTSHDHVLAEAATTAFEAAGENGVYVDEHRGYTRRLDTSALERLAARAGWNPGRRPWTTTPSFVDHADAWVANTVLVALARDFATANPDVVTLYIDSQEQQWAAAGYAGSKFDHEWLLTQGPQHAIARDWAGGPARHHLTQQLEHVTTILYRAFNELREAGLNTQADKLERALKRE